MDFITRKSKDLRDTEVLYGKGSSQYRLHRILLEAEEIFRTTGSLTLGKRCKMEYLTVTFFFKGSNTEDAFIFKKKGHWDIERVVLRKTNNVVIGRKSISAVVENEVYKLIVDDGYEIIKG